MSIYESCAMGRAKWDTPTPVSGSPSEVCQIQHEPMRMAFGMPSIGMLGGAPGVYSYMPIRLLRLRSFAS